MVIRPLVLFVVIPRMSNENAPQADLRVCKTGTVRVKINTIVKGCKCFWVAVACLVQQEMAAEQSAVVVGFEPWRVGQVQVFDQ